MKTYKTTKAILSHSLADINAGLWCKGKLAKFGTCDSGAEIGEDDLFWTARNEKTVDLLDKPTGCALGMVSMYAGLGEVKTYKINGVPTSFFVPRYPSYADGKGVEGALRALFNALPKYVRSDYDPDEQESVVEAIYEYNDLSSTTKSRARQWFTKALASAS